MKLAVKNIIAIASGKGGVGKSTMAVNIALSLNKMGFKTGILDADIYGPSIPIMLDVENEKPLSINIDGQEKIKPIEVYGIFVLSIGFFSHPHQAIIWRGPMTIKALRQLIHETYWGNLDFLIIDLPPGTGDIHLSLLQEIPLTGVIMVSTPQKISLLDVRKSFSLFKMKQINVPILGIIENMSYFSPEEYPENRYDIFGNKGAQAFGKACNIPFLGEIPIIQSIREAGDVGRPAVLQENTFISHRFMEITKKIIQELIYRNIFLPKTKSVPIIHQHGCSSKK